jgi:hypothetical protein
MKTTKVYFLIIMLCTVTFSACQTSESKNTDRDVYLKMEDHKTSVKVSVKNDIKCSLKNAYLMRA